MGALNKVMLIGNLGKDPEVRAIPSGVKVANFSIATTEKYKDREGQMVEKTEWHNIVMWRGLAEVAEKYLKKGSQIFVEGRLQTRSWDDQAGVKKYMTEIVCDNMVMLGRPRGEGGPGGGERDMGGGNSQPQKSGASGNVPPAPEDDLPF